MIRHGEEQLHKVCELLCETFLDSTYTLQSVVIGEVETTKERFTLVKSISPGDLYSQTDLDLGTRQLRRLRYHDGGAWSRASLVANVVEYQPAGITSGASTSSSAGSRPRSRSGTRSSTRSSGSIAWSTPTSSCGTWAGL